MSSVFSDAPIRQAVSLPLPQAPACNHCTCAYYVTNDRGKADILSACRKDLVCQLFFPPNEAAL